MPMNRVENFCTPLMNVVHNSIIGDGTVFDGPFGKRAVLYCDYTASGRPLSLIENYIEEYVMQYYANTHTTTCVTARQTTQFRHDAKEIIKRCVNAGPDDVVIFVGSGTTAAVHKLVGVLRQTVEKPEDTVVFVSAFEHHSNLLPWMEAGYEVVRIKEASNGCLDVEDLESKLKEQQSRGKRLIASLNAASNITGIVTDTVLVAELLHRYNAYSFWDYATAAPYLKIDMNASPTGYKDAIFCSPHKFVGGPGTPGLLIAKRHLFQNEVPHGAGGGTVLYVISDKHKYLSDIEAREEGGTPAIIESIRAGLVFRLKESLGTENIERREEYLYQTARRHFLKVKNLLILGRGSVKRLPIFSFLVWNPQSKKYLHHNFVSALLNDVFGIQTRGGCACAGPYAECLLGIDGQQYVPFLEGGATATGSCSRCAGENYKSEHEALEIMKPGFVRLNLSYFMTDEELQFILQAVTMAAEHGWRLLPQYVAHAKTSEWRHRRAPPTPMSLLDVNFGEHGLKMSSKVPKVEKITHSSKSFQKVLKEAEKIFSKAGACAVKIDFEKDEMMEDLVTDSGNIDCLWFLQPHEAVLHATLSNYDAAGGGNSPRRSTIRRSLRYFRPRKMSRSSYSSRKGSAVLNAE
jgi:selenocysteine lyase/cysteine desulfurase